MITDTLMINGVAVVSASAEIDILNAEQLRTTLREAGRRGHATVVVDMTGTRFCDSEGFSVLAGEHKWALPEGGGLPLLSSTIALRLSSQPAWCSVLPSASPPSPRRPHSVRARSRIPRGRWARVPGIRHPLMINGMSVVTAPAEIDVTTADQLRAALLHAGDRGHLSVTVDDVRQARHAHQAFAASSLDAPLWGSDDPGLLADVLGKDDPDLAHATDIEAIRAHLDELPERDQRILMLRFYGNLTTSRSATASASPRCTSHGCWAGH
jgi:anti-anti-sigma factor